MSEYAYTEEGTSGERSSGVNRWFFRLLLVVAVILAAELLWLFGITPLLPVSALDVQGLPGVDRSWILSEAGIGPHSSWITVNAEEAERRLSRLYLVESAHVVKEYPDRVRIFLEPRRPAALILSPVEGRLRPVYLDRHGMIIQIGDTHPELESPLALPILSGFGINNLYLGWRIHILENLLSRLFEIRLASPELLRAVSEIRINSKPYSGFDLTLYPVNSGIRFRVEADLDGDILRYIILMLDVFNKSDVDVDEVDLRGGTASFVMKEVSSG
ncbi:MAG: FtsQ-type POTRA domain-containing protein [Spirochaetaceae bacterium]|jgi:cell division protein FtsQ|nr:FtsQ-type POTRA domain-containing protein [Spirochaetaceae bacterium]